MHDVPRGWTIGKLESLVWIKSGSVAQFDPLGSIPVMGANGQIGRTSQSNFGPGYLVGRVGAAGAVNRIDGPCWASDNVLTVLARDHVMDESFLGHLLRYANPAQLATRQAQPLITQTNLGALRVRYPICVGEQRRIAEILDALDDCVERSVAVQEKLHVIERGILYDNFSTRERSADNWTRRSVAEVGEVKLGRQRSPQHESGSHMTPYLRVANVFENYIDYSDVLEMNFTPAERSVYSLERGDILLNEGQSLELVGRSAIFDGPPGMCFQNTLVRFRPKLVSPEYAQAVFRHWLHAGEFAKIAKRTTSIAHLGVDRFARMSFPIASQEHERRIVNALRALQERSDIERRRCKSLKQLKQGLAEDLLTGRVRVPEAEAVVESL